MKVMTTTSTVEKASRSAVLGANRRSGSVLMAAALLGLALGGGAFGLTRQSGPEAAAADRDTTHWQAVVAHYEAMYWAQLTPAERDAAHWRAVIEQYESRWPAINR
jgi:hypothetical protein